jgi:hypothetical protein
MGTIFTCPGIAKPIENKKNNILPVTLNNLEIAYAAKLAKSKVKNTEARETITEFLNGVATLPVPIKVFRLSRLNAFGNASGFE